MDWFYIILTVVVAVLIVRLMVDVYELENTVAVLTKRSRAQADDIATLDAMVAGVIDCTGPQWGKTPKTTVTKKRRGIIAANRNPT